MNAIVAGVLILVLLSGSAVAQDPAGQYANSPWGDWFARQKNAAGDYCCGVGDGHLYYGNYTLNADGSVTLPVQGGGTVTVKTPNVIPYRAEDPDPNPTGTTVLWYKGILALSTSVFCVALGPLT